MRRIYTHNIAAKIFMLLGVWVAMFFTCCHSRPAKTASSSPPQAVSSTDTSESVSKPVNIGDCSASDSDIYAFIDMMEAEFPKSYGTVAQDSIKSSIAGLRALHAANRLIVKAEEIPYVPDTTAYHTWLSKVFKGAKTTADSIELMCKWIPAHFAYGDYETVTDNLPPDSIYYYAVSGRLHGGCGSYSTFLCKLAAAHQGVWGWGVPISLNGEADKRTEGAGKLPSHNWVGFVKPTGEIWCLADPTIGGLVRDRTTQKHLSYDTITKWLRNPHKCKRVYVDVVRVSVQAFGPCALSVHFRNIAGLHYFKSQRDIVIKAEWLTYCENGSLGAALTAPYWKKENFPKATVYNIYCKLKNGLLYSNSESLRLLVAQKYPCEEIVLQ